MRVRPYEPRDRVVIRQICCDTADKGEPVERFLRDREVFADLVTSYYTDYEPQSTWVAEREGQVVGYLTGCLNTRRHRWITFFRIAPIAILKAIGRGTPFRRQTCKLLRDGLKTWLRGGFRREVPLDKYPAHFHINVRQGFRGHEIGRHLIESFLQQAKAAGLKGIHLVTRKDNLSARHFFEQMGFTALSHHPTDLPQDRGGSVHDAVIYGKQL